MKKWRVLYDGGTLLPMGVVNFQLLIDMRKAPAYVKRAIRNVRQRVKLGNGLLQLRISGGSSVGEKRKTETTHNAMPEVQQTRHAGREVLHGVRHGNRGKAQRGTRKKGGGQK